VSGCVISVFLINMSVPLRSALKSRPDSPSPTPLPIESKDIAPVNVPPISHSIASSSSSSPPQSYVNATIQHPPGHQTSSPAPSYTPKVSFDTFENPVANMFSFTLQVKSEGYRRTRNTRVFLCASSPDESGREALEWSLESLVQEGDELIVFRGVDEDVLGDFLFLLFYFGKFSSVFPLK
jgi:hypothetical protein